MFGAGIRALYGWSGIMRTIGIARAKAKIGLQNLAYGIRQSCPRAFDEWPPR